MKFYNNRFSCSRVALYSNRDGRMDRREEAISKAWKKSMVI